MQSIFLAILFGLVFGYAGLLLFAYFFAEKLIFHPPLPTYLFDGGLAFPTFADAAEEVKIKAKNSSRDVAGLFLEKKSSKYCVLYSHGNGEDLGMIKPLLENYAATLGVSVFSYDYFGYGATGGRQSRENMLLAAEAAWSFLSEKKGYEPQNIILAGYSLGSVPTAHLAKLHSDVRGAVLIGGIAKGVLTILPVDVIPWKILDNLDKWKNMKVPLLVIHGTRDAIVPVRNGKAVFEAAKGSKRAVWFNGCGHLDVHEFAPKVYFEEIEKFIKNPNYEKSSSVNF